MELYRIKSPAPHGRKEVVFLIVNSFSDVAHYLKQRKLVDPEVNLVAADYGRGSKLVDARKGAVVQEALPLPARHDARIERLKLNFSARACGARGHGPGRTCWTAGGHQAG